MSEKRLVLRHPSGLHQILGVCPEQPAAFLPLVRPDGVNAPINLVAVKPRYYLFTFVQAPALTREYDQAQR